MKYLLLSLVLLVGCSTYNVTMPVEISKAVVLCEIENDSMEYCFSLWTISDKEEDSYELDSYNSAWLTGKRFICEGPSNGFEVLCIGYKQGFDGGITHVSTSRILTPVSYWWGEVPEDNEQSRGVFVSNGYKNEKGQIMYKLAPLEVKRSIELNEHQRQWIDSVKALYAR